MLSSGAAPPKRTDRSLDSAFRNHSQSRRLRIEIPRGLDHVLNRGVDRADIVRDEEDRHEWFWLFNRVATRDGWRVFSQVPMANQFSDFLKLTDVNLTSGRTCQ